MPFLLPRLHAFFRTYLIDPDSSAPHEGWFSAEDVPLKWHYPVGLLYDLYSGAEPATADDQTLASTLKGLRSRGPVHAESSGDIEEAAAEGGVELGGDAAATESSGDGEQDTLPWKIVVHFNDWPTEDLVKLDKEGKQLLDSFRNSVKEAGFIRHGTGKVVMSLSYEDSTQMWRAVEEHNLELFTPVQSKLLNPPGMNLKNLPVRIYLPNASSTVPTGAPSPSPGPASPNPEKTEEEVTATAGTLRVIQSLVSPFAPSGGSRQQPQTLGMALNTLLPALFPSRRSPLLALPVLHGAVVPLAANVEELTRAAGYADGWLHIAVRMMT